MPGDMAGQLDDALSTLTGKAADKVLVGDLMGATLTGSDGNTIGTISNLAAMPGGRIVAVLIEMPDGRKVGLPFQAIKLGKLAGNATDKGAITVPMTKDQVAGMQKAKDLAKAIAP